ncbi:transcription termination factor NusA [Nitratidesulfovibrio vulgaris]|uniref:transcription termination factor NusA n=1 Tax=Nitratidesulfovibrio vulgaris TaxID=881 RepID=UPI0013DFAA0B|nr:transcription termination factor NusA [Nitratidesulfovibrio vulgaris]
MSMELKKAIDQISKDKGLERDMLVATLEEAVRTSVVRKYGDDIDVEVSYNDESGEIEVYQFKIVVAELDDEDEDGNAHIVLEEARKHDPSVQIDDEMGFRLKVEDLGRIAAQSAKQVIIQRMRDAEQELIYDEFKDRRGEIISGIIQRRDKAGWIINLGRTEALLPKEEQIPREHYKRGDRVQAIIIEVRKEGRGPQVIVSRSHRDYMAALFRREVPEVDDGTVQIMGVARDPGSRAKVAVLSRERDVDPVGACVGIRGSRIQNVVQELRGERIDIVVWSPEIATYARNALSPAVISRIVVDEEENLLEVIVPDDQLTNAIGRKGQNVKLAAKLLGWKIDIYTETRYNEANAIGRGLEQIASVAEISIEQFVTAGFQSIERLREASDEELASGLGIDDNRIADLRAAINFLSPAPSASNGDDADGETE